MFSNLSFLRKKTLVRVISVLLLQTFLLYNIAYTAPAENVTIQEKEDTLAPYVVSQLVLEADNSKLVRTLDKAVTAAKKVGDTQMMSFAERAKRVQKGSIRAYLRKCLKRIQKDYQELDIVWDIKDLNSIFFGNLVTKVVALAGEGQLENEPYELVGKRMGPMALEELDNLCREMGIATQNETPGRGPARTGDSEKMLTLDEAHAFDSVLEKIFDYEEEHRGAVKKNDIIDADRGLVNSQYVVIEDEVWDQFVKEYNADPANEVKVPMDLEAVPGTNKTRFDFDPTDPEYSYDHDVKKFIYIKTSRYKLLSKDKEKLLRFALHENEHIRSAMGLIPATRGDRSKEEGIIRHDLGYDISDIIDEFRKLRDKEFRDYYEKKFGDIFARRVSQDPPRELELKDLILESVDYFLNTGNAIPLAIILERLIVDEDTYRYGVFKDAIGKVQTERAILTNGIFTEALKAPFLNDYQRNEIVRMLRGMFKPVEVPDSEKVAVIMAGGGGTRLWPLSTSDDPKQLLKLFEFMSTLRISLERTIEAGFKPENVYVQTIPVYKEQIRGLFREMGLDPEKVIAEPEPADTAAAFGYAFAKLVRKHQGNKAVFIGTADHIIGQIDTLFKDTVNKALSTAWRNPLIGTIGITPKEPNEELGHINKGPETLSFDVFPVARFEEKPKGQRAVELFERGDLFNSGMFLATGNTVMSAFEELAPSGYYKGFKRIIEASDEELEEVEKEVFREFAKWKAARVSPDGGRGVSFDYVIAEPLSRGKATKTGIFTVPGDFYWEDIGSFYAICKQYMEGLYKDAGGNWRREGTNVVIENPGDNVTVTDCEGCLVFIKEKAPGDETPVEIAIGGQKHKPLKDMLIVYNPRTKTTMVAPLKVAGSLLKEIQGEVLKQNAYTAQFIKGGEIILEEKRAEVVNVTDKVVKDKDTGDDKRIVFEERAKDKGVIKSRGITNVKASCNEGLLVLLGTSDLEVRVNKVAGKRGEIEINVRRLDEEDWEISDEPRPVTVTREQR
ncbi:MAG: sugar phosphate nucleotidyltransferase, partial [Candidatus Omnitrophota bacterium]